MIIFQQLNLVDINEQGKRYKYERPENCPKCNSSKIWGHGFVARNFDGYLYCLYLKRWICADCNCVISIRPLNYFPRHHCLIQKIYECIEYRIANGTWIRGPDLNRQRQGHWYKALNKNIRLILGFDWAEKMLDGFQQLIAIGQCPIYRPT